MRKRKWLAGLLAVAVAVTTLMPATTFAEEEPLNPQQGLSAAATGETASPVERESVPEEKSAPEEKPVPESTPETAPEPVQMAVAAQTVLLVEEADAAQLWDGVTADTAWYDAVQQTYTIHTAAEFAGLAKLVNEGTATFAGKTVLLDADLDLNGQEWTPIGGADTGKNFAGTFDGQSHTISNLKISRALSNVSSNNKIGLFGSGTAAARIQNFTLHNAEVTGCLNVAAVLGGSGGAEARVNNVHVTGRVNVHGWWYVGGILGKGYSQIAGCSVEGDGPETSAVSITGGYVGGIVGFMGEDNNVTSGCTVKNITVSGAYNGIGGINGILHYGNTIRDCTVENVVVWQTEVQDEDTGRIYVGAFAGTYLDNGGKTPPTLSGCDFTGAIYSGPDKTDVLEPTRYVGSLWYGAEPPATVNISDCTIHMPPVAQIGNDTYETLSAAIEAAQPGQTVTLLRDVTLDDSATAGQPAVRIDKTLTLDGNGHTIHGNGITGSNTLVGFQVESGTVTFRNMTLTDFDRNVNAPYGSVIKIDAGSDTAKVIADGLNISRFARDAFTFKAGSFEIRNTVIDCKPGEGREKYLTKGLQIGFSTSHVQGLLENVRITNSSSNYTQWSTSAVEVYNNAEVTLLGGSIENCKQGIWVDNYWAGSNSYPTLTGDNAVTIDGTRITAISYAVLTYGREGTKTRSTVTIRDGVFDGEIVTSNPSGQEQILITGGSFSHDPTAFVPEGYQVTGDAPYLVSKIPTPVPTPDSTPTVTPSPQPPATATPDPGIGATPVPEATPAPDTAPKPVTTPVPTAAPSPAATPSPAPVVPAEATPAPANHTLRPTAAPTKEPAASDDTTAEGKTVAQAQRNENKAVAVVERSQLSTAVEQAIGEAQSGGSAPVVTVEITAAEGADAVEVTLPVEALSTLSEEEDAVFTVTSAVAEVTFDRQALAAIAQQAGNEVVLVVSPVAQENLSQAQAENVSGQPVFELSLQSQGVTISNFREGNATVTLPYTLAEGQQPEGVVVWYLAEDGGITPCETTYNADGGKVRFVTPHFSYYTIAYDESRVPTQPENETSATQESAAEPVVTQTDAAGIPLPVLLVSIVVVVLLAGLAVWKFRLKK